MNLTKHILVRCTAALLCGLLCGKGVGGEELQVDDIMYLDPELVPARWSPSFSPLLKPLWLQALEAPDSEVRRLAADTISLAVARGMTGLESAEGKLLTLLKSDRDALVRRAAARALVTLDARSGARELSAAAAADGLLMAQIVEPALARWHDRQMPAVWLARLAAPETPRGWLLLAIESLGTCREQRAGAPLISLVEWDRAPPEMRLAAARAAGRIGGGGLYELASKLAARSERPEFLGRLLATNLLGAQKDERSIELLRSLAMDQEPSVALAALGRLREIDPNLAVPFADRAIASPDAGLRHLGAELLAGRADAAAVQSLAPLLGDRNPRVRNFVARKFVELAAREELRQLVLTCSLAVLSADDWRGLEQAALVLGRLDHEPAAPRLLELLQHPRAEAAVAAAWALRKLAVPETFPALHKHAETLHSQMNASQAPTHAGRQASQILQAFGEMRYAESEVLLRKFLPKLMPLDPEARAAACWSLGYLHEKSPDDDLARIFAQRLADTMSSPAEFTVVRRLAAVALGRMGAKSELTALRTYAAIDGPHSHVGLSCSWAIERITGEKMAPTPPPTFRVGDWFLEPLAP